MISIICPSRGRPTSLYNMIYSATSTSSKKTKLEFCVRLDNDDDQRHKYEITRNLKLSVGEPKFPNMTKLWEECFDMSTGDVIMIANDDIIFETENWDLIIEEEFKDDPIKLVYGQDGIQNQALSTFPFISRKWCDTLGYCVQPFPFTFFHDTWLNDIADMIGVKTYREDLVLTHRHKSTENKERHDEMFTYFHDDQRKFTDLLFARQIAAEKLRSVL